MRRITRFLVVLLVCLLISISFSQHTHAEQDTTWQNSWDKKLKQYDGKDIIVLKKYKGYETDVYVPNKAIISGVEYEVWIRDPQERDYIYPLVDWDIENIAFEKGVKAGKYLEGLFRDCEYLESIDFGDMDFSNSDIRGMFDRTLLNTDSNTYPFLNTEGVINAYRREEKEYKYPAFTELANGYYGIIGPEAIERVYCLNAGDYRAFPGTILLGDGQRGRGYEYYKLISANEYVGSNYKKYTEKKLSEDDMAKIAAAILFVDEVECNWWESKYDVVQNVIWHITDNHSIAEDEKPSEYKYFNDIVLKRYLDIKDRYDMNVYVPENGRLYQNLAGLTKVIGTTKASFEGKKILNGREFKEGDEFTFTISSNDKKAPLPENTEITIKPVSGNEFEFKFDEITFSANMIGKTFTYRVKESGEVKGVVNDYDIHTVDVTVKVVDEELIAECKYSDGEKLIYNNQYYDDFIIRKVDQNKEPLKDVKFAVYGKPQISAESTIIIEKIRDYQPAIDYTGLCPPIWKSIRPGLKSVNNTPEEQEWTGCRIDGQEDYEKFYIEPEVTIAIEGIDGTDFYKEETIAKNENFVLVKLKTGKYRISELAKDISRFSPSYLEQSYLYSYDIEIDKYGKLISLGNTEWKWLTFDEKEMLYVLESEPSISEWSDKVSVTTDKNVITITNFSSQVEHEITIKKIRDGEKTQLVPEPCHPKVPEPCHPKVPEPVHPKTVDAEIESVDTGCEVESQAHSIEQQEEQELQQQDELLEPQDEEQELEIPCEVSTTENVEGLSNYISETIILFFDRHEGSTQYFIDPLLIEQGVDSGTIKLKPGIYSLHESYIIPEHDPSVRKQQSILDSFKFELTKDGKINVLENANWLWVDYIPGSDYPDYRVDPYKSEWSDKVSLKVEDRTFTITNFASAFVTSAEPIGD